MAGAAVQRPNISPRHSLQMVFTSSLANVTTSPGAHTAVLTPVEASARPRSSAATGASHTGWRPGGSSGWARRAPLAVSSVQAAPPAAAASLAPHGGDPETQQRLQERSQALLQRRQQLQARASTQEQEQQARLAQVHASAAAAVAPLAERDPGRLLQSTTTAQLRRLSVAAVERTAKDSGCIRDVPRRAMPVWCRQGAG